MTKVRLNDLKYRYDVYQMLNLFYSFNDIDFVEGDYDIDVEINLHNIVINNKEISKIYNLLEEVPVKEQIKKSVFLFLKDLTGKELPWGTLIGIRPSKIATSLLNEGMKEDEIVGYFYDHYLASEEKAKLCMEVAKNERETVTKNRDSISVYIGMPFCPTRCLYCSFTSNPIGGNKALVESYLQALNYEIEELGKFINEHNLNIQCVYFGGGTPTSVNDSQFEEVMKKIFNTFVEGRNIEEFTVECGRPDSITESKLKTMKNYLVGRISINPQTMNDDTLKAIGRNHSVSEVKNCFNLARQLGFDNINMDIIVGLPGEGIDHVKNTCEEIQALNPENLTVHGMSVKRASKLYEKLLDNYKLKELKQSEINEMYNVTAELSKKLHMKPYYMYRQKNMVGNMENVGYAKADKEGIYNIQMIEDTQTIIALGADAVSKIVFFEENRIERFANVKDIKEYVNRIEEMVSKKIELLGSLYN